MYGLPDSAVLGTAKRLKKVAKKSAKKSKAKAKGDTLGKPHYPKGSITFVVEEQPKPNGDQKFVEAMIYLVMPMIWLAEYYNKKRAERDTLKK